MGKIEIVNMRIEKPSTGYDIKVDRSSLLGNPYPMGNESEREKVLTQYKAWFWGNLKNQKNIGFTEAFKELVQLFRDYEKIRLFCWCAPKRCHADIIKEAVIYLYGRIK